MRLIVKEYLLQLKEKDELDFLLCDLFLQKGYTIDNIPKTGMRQYGVDIKMHNENEYILFVVKKGDIDRQTWDGNQNAVRESFNEIQDSYIPNMKLDVGKKKIRIILATNGSRDQSIELNYNNYVERFNKNAQGKVFIEFMGIDDIVEGVLQHIFNEYLFDESMRSNLRKALYFVGEGDYKRQYYERIIDDLIEKMAEEKTNNKIKKICATIYLASQMICQYAHEESSDKIAINVTEYLLIKFWKYMYVGNRCEKTIYTEWLIRFCKKYEKWNDCYFAKIKCIVDGKAFVPMYSVVERRCLAYEMLGYMLSYVTYLEDYNPNKAEELLNDVIKFVNDNSELYYAPYDRNIAEIIMLFHILDRKERKGEMIEFIKIIVFYTMNSFLSIHWFPAPSDTYAEATKIFENGYYNIEYPFSATWGYLLLMIAYYGLEETYDQIKGFLCKELKNTTKNVWFISDEEEEKLYDYNAMSKAGVGVSIEVQDSFDDFKARIETIVKEYRDRFFSFEKYGFSSLEMIICRYYGYIPRVYR